ncbi:uncharacterized protein LOC130980622 [Arachis stenosperma]|uniref:uncharacterized protein LOC130980622 n=1 Tax=Arachis stenosperma TaxID=217475 RepID=UPI0025AD98C3|nr:uncharacterized protein LOC130980622 [Arachis stenosperma]
MTWELQVSSPFCGRRTRFRVDLHFAVVLSELDLRISGTISGRVYFESYGACDDVEREFDEIERNEMRQQQASRIPTPSSRKGVGKQVKGLQSFFPPAATPGAQPSIKSVLQSKEIVEKCDIAIARWMMDASVPFNAVNSAYYQPMIDAIANMGAGYKGPNYQRVRGYLLSKLVEDVKKMIEGYRVIWKQTGCTIMADGWTDRCRRTLINFLVYCPKGTIFLKSVDAFHISKTAEALFKLLRDVVLFVGPENVVHVVTDNAANYVAAGRLLESEFPRLYWSPCAAHCINLMLQDIGKFVEVTETVSQASMITKYIYNHCHPLYLMRQFTGGREILRPAPTRFATNFIALQSILAQKDALRAMLTEPLVHVLRIVDSEDRAAMGFLYQAMYKAREDMVKRFQKRKRVVEPYLKILDSRWDLQLKRNLHAAGYWLNPAFRFNYAEFDKHKDTISGLLDVIERYAYGDADLITKLTSEKRIFKNAEGDFGRQSAIRERSTVMPDQWWESYGCGAPNLQKLAIRVLSQTCSSSGCERNWSIFEHIHSKKRNRLEHQKLNDLVYVHYNLRLQQRNRMRKQSYDPICLDAFEDHSEWIMEDSPPFLTPEEVDALRNDLANMSLQSTLDDLDELNLEDDRDDGEANNTSVKNANQNETNQDVAPDLLDEERFPDFEVTPWI